MNIGYHNEHHDFTRVNMKKNNKLFPHLPEEDINKLVKELTDPKLSPLSRYTEEELLLLRVLERKLEEGVIKAEMTNDGKL